MQYIDMGKQIIRDAKNLYGWAVSQKLPTDGFKWKNNMLKFNEGFINDHKDHSDKAYIFLK